MQVGRVANCFLLFISLLAIGEHCAHAAALRLTDSSFLSSTEKISTDNQFHQPYSRRIPQPIGYSAQRSNQSHFPVFISTFSQARKAIPRVRAGACMVRVMTRVLTGAQAVSLAPVHSANNSANSDGGNAEGEDAEAAAQPLQNPLTLSGVALLSAALTDGSGHLNGGQVITREAFCVFQAKTDPSAVMPQLLF